jgi:thiamine biosynthesis lipoprotein
MRPDPALQAHHFEALGTTCSLFGVGTARDAMLEGEAWIHELGARLTRFRPDSELTRLNAAGGRWVDISPELEALLRESLRAFELSAGLVNVAVQPAMVAIGYAAPLARGHTAIALDTARPLPPLPQVLDVGPGRARVWDGCGLDLGGVAKGWMADRLCGRLGRNTLANLGGDLRATGPGPGGEGWPVGVGGVTLWLRDRGAATSSVRRRRWAGVHHLVDPRTGLPASTGLEEVSVVAASGFEAEVIAKTALLCGPDTAPAYCAAHAAAWSLR